jgi:succinate dehydrogenase/fumarate reductase flavoprotein subunit
MPAKQTEVSFDVVVIGGGVAGQCAAIAAHDAGARTLLLEASSTIGGTASWSGGALWVPLNRQMAEIGQPDSREDALAYMRSCAGDVADETVYTAYLDAAAEVTRYLEDATPLELVAGLMPDYQGGKPGGVYTPGTSRSVAPTIFNINRLGEAASLLRRSPHGTVPFTYGEFADMDAVLHPERIDADLYAERTRDGYLGWGEALAGMLLLGLLERGVEIRVDARVTGLDTRGGKRSVTYKSDSGTVSVAVDLGVILCCGGYEWDRELMQENFPGVPFQPATPPTNRGDGWRIAEAAGACIDNRGTCWGWPGYTVPGEQIEEGEPLVRSALVERTLPHLILVNRHGQRFVDESLPYHTILKAMIERDENGEFINLPAFHIFDGQFREKYAFGPVAPGSPLPDWIQAGDDLGALAAAIGVDAAGLQNTIDQFNADVADRGTDSHFHRGEQPYGRFWGDQDNQPTPNLGTLEHPPFHAVSVFPSMIGTCGGPRIDSEGRVLDNDGKPVPGLYAAGNVTAAISGPAYFGPGGTIGPAMVFGVLAGRAAVADGSGS